MVDSTQMIEQKQRLLKMLNQSDTREKMLVALTNDLTKVKPSRQITKPKNSIPPPPRPQFNIKAVRSTNQLLEVNRSL